MDSAIAQLSGNNNNIIQITSTSSYTDELGNFHIIGEINSTSTQPQSNIVVTAILSDTTTNSVVGNYSAFSSIQTLRSGELSPFDIVIQNPQQILGKFNFMEFSTTSQPATAEKQSTLALNGSNSFVDNVGNPHITGNIINQGPTPEQLLNLAITFYDNSSLGVVGTQSFELNVVNLANNQMTPFDITIIDNKTKSQAAFYSINMDSTQSSVSPPFNPKFTFASQEGFVDSGLFLNSPLNVDPLPTTGSDFTSSNNNNNNDDSGSDEDDSGSSSSNHDLDVQIDISKDHIVRGNIQTITVEVSDDDTNEKISDARVNGEVEYASGSTSNGGNFDKDTEGDGEATHSWRISGNANPGTFDVTVKVTAPGYNTETDETSFKVIEKSEDTNGTSSQNNSTDSVNNNGTLANGDQNESNDDLDCKDIGESNIPVGDDDPNSFDGVGCESSEDDNRQTSNDKEGKTKTDDETTKEILEGIDGTVIGGTTGDSSDSGSEQTDRDGDGISNEQPAEGDNTRGNDSDNENENTDQNEIDENGEDKGGDGDANNDESDGENNN